MTVTSDSDGFRLTFDDDLPEDERRFYLKIYPNVNLVSERKVHCTICGVHIGTAPSNESVIRMHPILKVTHCKKCHEFYNSGEFSKGEDGSELYCRWCGQGGEVYCCSKCPYVFCTNCIVQNLSQDCVNDIEENENWNCFVCAPKIMWHLRAQHWALMNFIEKQKQDILDKNLTESAIRRLMTKDKSTCCKSKCGNISDSSCDSNTSQSRKRKSKTPVDKKSQSFRPLLPKKDDEASPEAKKAKPNDEVVCTPDVLSLIEQTPTATAIKVTPPNQLRTYENGKKDSQPQEKQRPAPQLPVIHQTQLAARLNQPQVNQLQVVSNASTTANSTPPMSIQSLSYVVSSSQAPPLAIRTVTSVSQTRTPSPAVVSRKSVIGNRSIGLSPGQSPVYHTINGFRIDLNTAAQQETFRLPNGKLIQVKRQGTAIGGSPSGNSNATAVPVSISNAIPGSRPPPHLAQIQPQNRVIQPNANVLSPQVPQHPQPVQQFIIQQPSLATIRYAPPLAPVAGPTNASTLPPPPPQENFANNPVNGGNQPSSVAIRPALPQASLIKHIFPATPLGLVRGQLQNQIFASMDICHHLIGKIHTLTNSNAYKTARNYTDVKELYIHLSYLFTYAIGRFKTIQERCMDDMRCLGFAGDAATLESGQLEKYSSDNDEDDIVIVEPKTTLIDLDSDEEDTPQSSRNNKKSPAPPKQPATPPVAPKQPTLSVPQHGTIPVTIPNNQPPPLIVKPTGTVIPPIGNIPAVIRPLGIQRSQMQQTQIQQPHSIQSLINTQQQTQIHNQHQLLQSQLHSQQVQSQPPTLHHPPQLQHMSPQQMQHSVPVRHSPPVQHSLPMRPSPPVLQQQQQTHSHAMVAAQNNPVENISRAVASPSPNLASVDSLECDLDFTANLLAGMLDVELFEGTETVQITAPPKKPRKKTTNKPNPHLIKQQQIQARERERELIKHDAKLNKKCMISLERIEDTNPEAKKKLQAYMASKNPLEVSLSQDSNCSMNSSNSVDTSCVIDKDSDENLTLKTVAEKIKRNEVDRKDESSVEVVDQENEKIVECNSMAEEESKEDNSKSDSNSAECSSEQNKSEAEQCNEENPDDPINDVEMLENEDGKATSDEIPMETDQLDAEPEAEVLNPDPKPAGAKEASGCTPADILKQLSDLVNVDKDDDEEQIELLEVIEQPDEEMPGLLVEEEEVSKEKVTEKPLETNAEPTEIVVESTTTSETDTATETVTTSETESAVEAESAVEIESAAETEIAAESATVAVK